MLEQYPGSLEKDTECKLFLIYFLRYQIPLISLSSYDAEFLLLSPQFHSRQHQRLQIDRRHFQSVPEYSKCSS